MFAKCWATTGGGPGSNALETAMALTFQCLMRDFHLTRSLFLRLLLPHPVRCPDLFLAGSSYPLFDRRGDSLSPAANECPFVAVRKVPADSGFVQPGWMRNAQRGRILPNERRGMTLDGDLGHQVSMVFEHRDFSIRE